MLREIRTQAAALAGEFGSAQRLADEVRLLVRRAPLVEARGIYLAPQDHRPRPALLLHREVRGDELTRLLVRAIAHDFLRHRGRFAYGSDGPLYDAPREQREVELFASEFQARCRPVANNIVAMRARLPAGIG